MESSARNEIELPNDFMDASIDHLASLIGLRSGLVNPYSSVDYLPIGDMLERLMTHNDRIPLSPYVQHTVGEF